MTWSQSVKSIVSDYSKGLSPFNPKTFSDDEEEEKKVKIEEPVEPDQENKGVDTSIKNQNAKKPQVSRKNNSKKTTSKVNNSKKRKRSP